MRYTASLYYLNSFINYEKLYLQSSPAWNIERMRFLLRLAGRPDQSFLPIVIVGTKGKGSTGFFLEAILQASGVRAGFYSSPHLEDPRERIRLGGEMISKKLWAQGLNEMKQRLNAHPVPERLGKVTYFEVMTLLAALTFQRQKVQVGIFEAGMGGRYDAVNALDHKLAMITPIDLDHQAVLGNTIAKIAAEKAAVIRSGEPVIVSSQKPQAARVIEKEIRLKQAELYTIKGSENSRYCTALGLAGDYQQINASAAVKAAELLRDRFGIPVTPEGIRQGLQAGNWPGRFELFHRDGLRWVLDSAHNPISIEALVRNLKAFYPMSPRTLVFGTSRDKDSSSMLKTLGGYFEQVILTQAVSSRSAEVSQLAVQARGHFKRIYPVANVAGALDLAKKISQHAGLVTVTGSFYVIGEARKIIKFTRNKNL